MSSPKKLNATFLELDSVRSSRYIRHSLDRPVSAQRMAIMLSQRPRKVRKPCGRNWQNRTPVHRAKLEPPTSTCRSLSTLLTLSKSHGLLATGVFQIPAKCTSQCLHLETMKTMSLSSIVGEAFGALNTIPALAPTNTLWQGKPMMPSCKLILKSAILRFPYLTRTSSWHLSRKILPHLYCCKVFTWSRLVIVRRRSSYPQGGLQSTRPS